MKLILSLTSIPPRFSKLPELTENLRQQICNEIWVNIPKTYKRFPEWDGVFPWTDLGPKVIINRDCEDLGPGTQALGPIFKTDADIIVYVNDDTYYEPKMTLNLVKWFSTTSNCVWGLSGFDFETYFRAHYPRQHGVPIDVLESYGAVISKPEWLRNLYDEFVELSAITWNDDILLANLYEKHGIQRKTVFTPDCNLGQLNQQAYGFGDDALHHLAAKESGIPENTHAHNNKLILKNLEDKGKNYFSYKCL